MNTQKTMDHLYSIARKLPADALKNYDFCMKHPNEVKTIADASDDLGALVAVFMLDLQRESIADSAKKCGKLDRLKAAQRIINGRTPTVSNVFAILTTPRDSRTRSTLRRSPKTPSL